MKIYNKLVRDKIPEIIESAGGTPRCYVLTSTEYRQALIAKLIEEAHELSNASTKPEILEELADVATVLCSLMKELGFSDFDVALRAHKKQVEKGGFERRIFLESVEKEQGK